MKKYVKLFISLAVIIVISTIGILAYSAYRNNKFAETVMLYIEDKYGIKTAFEDIENVHRLPTAEWSKDVLLTTENNTDIRVRINADGTVYSDDYYFFLLENELKEQFEKKAQQLWEKSSVSVHISTIDEMISMLGGDTNYPMNNDLGLENPALIDIMNRSYSKIDIEELKPYLRNII